MTRQLAVNKFVKPDVGPQPTNQSSQKISFPFATLHQSEGAEFRVSGWFAAEMRSKETVKNTKVWVRLVKAHYKHLTMPGVYMVEYNYQVMGVKDPSFIYELDQVQATWALTSNRTAAGNLMWSYRQEALDKAWTENDSTLLTF
jgi:hypothetical protein